MPGDDRRLVYSTDGSLPLPRFDSKKDKRAKSDSKPSVPDDGVVRVGCEGRRGGSVTLVYGLEARELAAIGKELRRRCGTGGTAKNGNLELQGDHRDAVLAYFTERGRRTKRMGG
jgi:translation initiation factor 1